jgi:hypothetical protein
MQTTDADWRARLRRFNEDAHAEIAHNSSPALRRLPGLVGDVGGCQSGKVNLNEYTTEAMVNQ